VKGPYREFLLANKPPVGSVIAVACESPWALVGLKTDGQGGITRVTLWLPDGFGIADGSEKLDIAVLSPVPKTYSRYIYKWYQSSARYGEGGGGIISSKAIRLEVDSGVITPTVVSYDSQGSVIFNSRLAPAGKSAPLSGLATKALDFDEGVTGINQAQTPNAVIVPGSRGTVNIEWKKLVIAGSLRRLKQYYKDAKWSVGHTNWLSVETSRTYYYSYVVINGVTTFRNNPGVSTVTTEYRIYGWKVELQQKTRIMFRNTLKYLI
jgi:hypothetical protein